MAVSEQTPYIEYTANGTTTSFALEFDCDNQDHLIVLVDDVEPVVGAWSLNGGAVVFGNAPTSGKKITIQRNTPFRRDEDFQSYDNSFRPPGVNKGFDKIWLKLQELGLSNWLLKNYVDRKDDELKAFLLAEIQAQGVALDQLDEYYNYLMQRIAAIAVDKGWIASLLVDENGRTQQELNIINHNIKMYGAIGDGTLHKVREWLESGKYSSLQHIQIKYPHVTSLDDSIDWAVTQKLINSLPYSNTSTISPKDYPNGGIVLAPRGKYFFNRKILLKRGVVLKGETRESTQFWSLNVDGLIEYNDVGRYLSDEL